MRVDPSDDVNSSEDFLLAVVEGHILAAVMEVSVCLLLMIDHRIPFS